MLKPIVVWCSGFGILAGLYLAGELLSRWLGLFLPGSLVGMVLLTLLLFSGIVKLEQVEKAADGLLRHLILLFVPSAVGIMVFANSISGSAVEIILTALLSTVVVLVVTGKTVDGIIDWLHRADRIRKQPE